MELSPKLKGYLGNWEGIHPFFKSPEWPKIKDSIAPDMDQITPHIDNWFKAFRFTSPDQVKVVWLGMSPYFTTDKYTKNLTADGLAFSTDCRNSLPPSLERVYKGIEQDIFGGFGIKMERKNELDFLAYQGVLLLNSALTTVLGDSKKHLPVWEPFIAYVLKYISDNSENVVFTGFGANANSLLDNVDKEKHLVIKLEHPAAAAYGNREWKHEGVFNRTNEYLKSKNQREILWDNFLAEDDCPF